jgi:hypothetical protein
MDLMERGKGPSLVMLGTIHRDKRGPEMLEGWVHEIGPDVITLEFSRYGLDFRTMNGPELQGRVKEYARQLEKQGQKVDPDALGNLLDYIEPPFEFQVASRLAATRHIPLYLIDMDLFSSLRLRRIHELLQPENMEQLLTGKRPQENGERTLARLYFKKGVRPFLYPEEMHIRDRYMRDRIITLMRYHKASTILHICGWQHLCDPHGVYTQLNPTKVFIDDRTVRI